MNKEPAEPEEMRMPADQFDKMMRRALGVAPPPAEPKKAEKAAKRPASEKS